MELVVNTQGAFSYSEILAMELTEFYDVLFELAVLGSEKRKKELGPENQLAAIMADSRIRKV